MVETDLKNHLADREQQKDKLKSAYFMQKKQLAIDLLHINSEVCLNLLNQLTLENKEDKPNLLAELAYKNYKQDHQFKENSLDEFLFNFNQEGIFQSYIFEQMSIIFPDFQSLKTTFLPQALALGMKDVELF